MHGLHQRTARLALISNIPYFICLTSYHEWCHQVLSVIYRSYLRSTVRRRSDAIQIYHEVMHSTALTAAEHNSDLKHTIGAPFLTLTDEIWVVCCENLRKTDRVMAVPHCINPFPVAFGALLWVLLSHDVTSVLYVVKFTYFRINCTLLICTALSCGQK